MRPQPSCARWGRSGDPEQRRPSVRAPTPAHRCPASERAGTEVCRATTVVMIVVIVVVMTTPEQPRRENLFCDRLTFGEAFLVAESEVDPADDPRLPGLGRGCGKARIGPSDATR